MPGSRAAARLAIAPPGADTQRGKSPLERHFTVTGFLSRHGHTALHWHRLGMWLPPGGHVEPDEDPLAAVLREVQEETGMEAQVIPTAPPLPYRHPPQLPAPVTIGVYDIAARNAEPAHQHIDLVYFTRLAGAAPAAAAALPALPALPADPGLGWRWVGAAELAPGASLPGPDGTPAAVPEDVRVLALAAIRAADGADGAEMETWG